MRSAYDLETPRDVHWTRRAACLGMDPEMWSITGKVLTQANEYAKAVCRRCPVREQCRQFGLDIFAEDMIYGGQVFTRQTHANRPRVMKCLRCQVEFMSRAGQKYCSRLCGGAYREARSHAKRKGA